MKKTNKKSRKAKGQKPVLLDGSPTPITDRHAKDMFPKSIPKAPPKVLRIPGK